MKNAQSFFEEGRQSARMGNARSPGSEYSMPVFGEGQSWQAKAFARGFEAECKAMGHKVTGRNE